MDFRKFALVVASISALAPALALADPSDLAMSACVKAFAAKITSPGAAAPAVRVEYPQMHMPGSVLDYYARNYTFTMTARKVRSGSEFAHATCRADARGVVLSFNAKDLNGTATLAAR